MLTHLHTIDSLDSFEKFLKKNWSCTVKRQGGRVFICEEDQYRLNDIVKQLEWITSKSQYNMDQVKRLVERIQNIDNLPISYNSHFLKTSTIIRQFFGNLFYDRKKILTELAHGKLVTAHNNNYRYLVFNRPGGRIACRVHGNSNKTLPRLSSDKDFTFATRSILRNRNLLVFRGTQSNTHMIGPCDFYGPLENAHRYFYTIEIKNGFPKFYRREKQAIKVPATDALLTDFADCTAKIHATWHKGTDSNIEEIKNLYTSQEQKATGESLFPTSAGILEIEEQAVELPAFDATKFDLSLFKARLVKNDLPFSIAETEVSFKDSFCPVSYMFENDYANQQVERGGGLFLETHDFCQTMTPLDESAGGVVVLGRWGNEDKTVLELIGVKIPYGYTLIIEKGCIHGDTTLKGMFMMAMTSNHETMQTADVTFLKSKQDFKNFSLTTQDDMTSLDPNLRQAPTPIVDFGKEGEKQFTQLINNGWRLYNPFSRIFNPPLLRL